MSNLLDSLKGLVTNELVSTAAKSLGESESGISKAIGGLLPTLLSGVMNAPSSSHSMIGDLLGKAGSNSNLIGDLLGGISSGNQNSPAMGIGASLVKGILGEKAGGIVNLISNFAGIKSGSSSSLLSIAGSLLASFLGKKMLTDGLNIGGLMNWLGGSKKEVEAAIPSGFASFLSSAPTSSSSHSHSTSSGTSSNNEGGGMKWLLPLLLLGLLGLSIWWWLKGCNKEAEVSSTTTEVVNEAGTSLNNAADSAASAIEDAATATAATLKGKLDEAGNWIAERGEAIKIKLDNGTELDASKGFLEDRLFSFIKDPNATPGKDIWFNFEDLLFDTGKATLKAGSQKQLENTIAILKAYPSVKVKLGGYTDNTGDSLANVKLSESRAKTVYNQMIAGGLTPASFDDKPYEGYGPLHPVADNATPEGRGQNRRISLSVRAK